MFFGILTVIMKELADVALHTYVPLNYTVFTKEFPKIGHILLKLWIFLWFCIVFVKIFFSSIFSLSEGKEKFLRFSEDFCNFLACFPFFLSFFPSKIALFGGKMAIFGVFQQNVSYELAQFLPNFLSPQFLLSDT